MESQIWVAKPTNRASFGGLCVMHGGPLGMHLPEHEHPEVQLGMHFPSAAHSKPYPLDVPPAFFTLIPPGKAHRGGWCHGSEVVVALLSRSLIEEATDELLRASSSEIVAAPCAVDPVIQGLGCALRREFKSGRIRDPLYMEAIGVVFTRHLVRRWSSAPHPRPMDGRLTACQLRETFDAVEVGLKSGISIVNLATSLGMGTHRFTRLFGRSTGVSPYQYIVQRRLARARVLLEATSLPLTDIALELGFVSHSHFTSVFKQHHGTTPKAYRLSSDSSRGFGGALALRENQNS